MVNFDLAIYFFGLFTKQKKENNKKKRAGLPMTIFRWYIATFHDILG